MLHKGESLEAQGRHGNPFSDDSEVGRYDKAPLLIASADSSYVLDGRLEAVKRCIALGCDGAFTSAMLTWFGGISLLQLAGSCHLTKQYVSDFDDHTDTLLNSKRSLS